MECYSTSVQEIIKDKVNTLHLHWNQEDSSLFLC